jgi:hypothetical protein
VYAVGPIFHKNNTFPFIACWGIKSLSQSTLEDLENLFDYEFKAVFHQITEPVHCAWKMNYQVIIELWEDLGEVKR